MIASKSLPKALKAIPVLIKAHTTPFYVAFDEKEMDVLRINTSCFFLYGFSTAIVILVFTVYYKLTYWKRRGLPNDAASIVNQFLGPLHYVDEKKYKKYGKVFGIYEGFNPSLMLGNVDHVRQVLVTEFHKFSNHRFNNEGVGGPGSKMLFSMTYKPWKRVRSIISPSFSRSKIRQMTPLLQKNINALVASLDKAVDKDSTLDLKVYLSAFTLDVIANCGFGTYTNSLDNPDNPVAENVEKIFGKNITLSALVALFSPWAFKKLQLSVFNVDAIKNLTLVMEKVCEDRIRTQTTHNDMLDQMLSEMRESPEEGGRWSITKDEILDQGVLFFIAGNDTSSTALCAAAYCLATYPRCQEILEKEIEELSKVEEDLREKAIEDLKYLNAFILEVLRYLPPVPRIERRCVCDTFVGDIEVKKGTLVVIPIYAIQRDESNFPNPDQFLPERFLDSNENENRALLPFAAGPRNCIGYKFAMWEMKHCLVALIKRFRFEISQQTKVPPEYYSGQLVSKFKNMYLKVVKR